MGQGPLNCQKCNENIAVNKVLYENKEVIKMWDKSNPYKLPFDLKKVDFKSLFGTLDFASSEAKNIEDVVGKISISQEGNCKSSSIDIIMEQLLCNKCLKEIKFKKLPKEWKHIVFHNDKGYYQSQLP